MSEAARQHARYTWMRVKDVAERFDASPWHVRNWIRSGQLQAMNVGTGKRPDYRFLPEWIEAFADKRMTNG